MAGHASHTSGIIFAMILASSLAAPAFADQQILGCAACVDITPSATFTEVGSYTLAQVQVSNPTDNSSTGLVHAVTHDMTGQTVANSAGVLSVAPSANATVSILILGLTPGASYAVTFFAVSVDGVAMSSSYTASVTPTENTGTSNGVVPLGTDTLGLASTSSCPIIQMPCESYVNHSNSTVYAVAYLVLHNPLGQTVDISTVLTILTPGQQAVVSMPIVDPNGVASEFAVSADGFAISPLATVSF
jgi:hypothetical protein